MTNDECDKIIKRNLEAIDDCRFNILNAMNKSTKVPDIELMQYMGALLVENRKYKLSTNFQETENTTTCSDSGVVFDSRGKLVDINP